MLVDDLTEVIDRIASITGATIGIAEPASRIARVGNVGSVSIGNVEASIANRIQCQEDVASSQVCGSDIDDCRIRLVKDIEQSRTELNLLRLSDIEVLKERHVEVAAPRTANVERRLRWTRIGEAWYPELAQVVYLRTQSSSAYSRIPEIEWCHRT